MKKGGQGLPLSKRQQGERKWGNEQARSCIERKILSSPEDCWHEVGRPEALDAADFCPIWGRKRIRASRKLVSR